MIRSRCGLITMLAVFFVTICAALRIGLLFMLPDGAGIPAVLFASVMAKGLLFDLATFSYGMIPLALYLLMAPRRFAQHRLHPLLVRALAGVFVAVLLFDVCAEYLFFDEFGTRFNFIAVDYLIYTQEVIGNIRESYPLLPILSGIALASVGTIWLLRRHIDRAGIATFGQGARLRGGVLMLLPLASFVLVDSSRSTVSRSNAFANELAANGIYSLATAFRTNELSFTRFYRTTGNDRALARLKTLVAERNNSFLEPGPEHFTRRIRGAGKEKRLNLVVVVEESLSAEYLGSFGNRRNITPELDRLASRSLLFTGLYATGTRTVRGLEALSLSIPPLPGTSIVKRPDNGGFRSWGEIMRTKGYDTRFIYAGYGYFDNMNTFFSGNGFEVVDRAAFGRDEITFANIWGVCDEDLFRKALGEADRSHASGKPFFSMVMTTSNHRPYTYPSGRIDIPSKTGRDGGVKYADYSIGRLIAEASTRPWFRDTIFVIVADHCASSAGKTDIPIKKYKIPMLVYSPAHIAPGRVDRLMSQIDVAPTVLGLMNMSYDTDFLGRDILKDSGTTPRALISTYQKLGYLTEDRLVVLGPRKYAAQYEVNRSTGEARPTALDAALLDDALAYYQGSDHLYRNRLNRLAR